MANAQFFKNIIAKIRSIVFNYKKEEENISLKTKKIVETAIKKTDAKRIEQLKKNIAILKNK